LKFADWRSDCRYYYRFSDSGHCNSAKKVTDEWQKVLPVKI